MIKAKELSDPTSCLNRAHDDEPTFVLLGRDECAPNVIRTWAANRISRKKNWDVGDPQIKEALELADAMDIYRKQVRKPD